jgi:hypothetical protein
MLGVFAVGAGDEEEQGMRRSRGGQGFLLFGGSRVRPSECAELLPLPPPRLPHCCGWAGRRFPLRPRGEQLLKHGEPLRPRIKQPQPLHDGRGRSSLRRPLPRAGRRIELLRRALLPPPPFLSRPTEE